MFEKGAVAANMSRSRTISAVAVFTALAFVLNLLIKVPAPFAPFLVYQVWEVPILAAFLIFGAWAGVAVSVLNLVVLQVVYPGPLPSGPLYNLAAILATMLGVAGGHRLFGKRASGVTLLTGAATVLGGLSRVLIMTVVNGIFLPFGYPIGFSIPVVALPGLLTLIAIFNATLVLYTVPLAYLVLRTVSTRYRLTVAYPIGQRSLGTPAG
jgi:riboflavin transporter FmnP